MERKIFQISDVFSIYSVQFEMFLKAFGTPTGTLLTFCLIEGIEGRTDTKDDALSVY